jgi:hypothetical protein
MSTLQSFFLWVQLGQLSITVVPASEVCVYRSIDPVLLFPAGPAMPLAGPSLRPDHGLPSSVVLGASLADSDSPLVNASVSENLPARSLVASDRFSVATSGSDQIISSSPTFPLVDSDLSEIFFRTSLRLVIASPCADVSFSSLADSSSTAMVLDTSVIQESRAPDAACSSLLDVTALGSPASPALSLRFLLTGVAPLSSPIKWGRPIVSLIGPCSLN